MRYVILYGVNACARWLSAGGQDLEESGVLPALLASDYGECGPGKLPAEEVAAECALAGSDSKAHSCSDRHCRCPSDRRIWYGRVRAILSRLGLCKR